MSPQPPRSSSSRETVLTLALTIMAAGGFIAFLVVLMGVFVVHAVVIFGILACVGCFHYLLWGRSMSQEAAVEREAAEAPEEAGDTSTETGIWTPDGPHGPRRY